MPGSSQCDATLVHKDPEFKALKYPQLALPYKPTV